MFIVCADRIDSSWAEEEKKNYDSIVVKVDSQHMRQRQPHPDVMKKEQYQNRPIQISERPSRFSKSERRNRANYERARGHANGMPTFVSRCQSYFVSFIRSNSTEYSTLSMNMIQFSIFCFMINGHSLVGSIVVFVFVFVCLNMIFNPLWSN